MMKAVVKLSAVHCELPHKNIGHRVTIPVYVLVALSTICVLLRFATKLYFVRSKLHLDDYVLGLCVVGLTDFGVHPQSVY